ncbi:MAG: phosphoadenylyl-sulfate reductase, partial [Crocinitomicaceae bacterium]|nr:phosphoadenylyl-sulfate reductase [Crocinitomicaceae bacterium]
FSTSFGKEDQVITHLIATNKIPVKLFTLDTGRLFEETYEVFHRTNLKYKLNIQTFFPDKIEVEKLISEKGPYSFYDSVENRKQCCFIRKIEPLKRALKGQEIWITGLRKEQSENRADMKMVEWDQANQIIKVHPIFEWTEKEVDDYNDLNNVPVNALHKKGFPSIGCSPCTRAIQPGEDFRAGRWWWEASKKECGLHSS